MKEKKVQSDPDLDLGMHLMRYMDLPKFIDLIRTSRLYFSSAVHFDDILEGTLPESIRKASVVHNKDHDNAEQSLGYEELCIQDFEYRNKIHNNICCWTIGNKDNMALWKIYGGSNCSVAISTNLEKVIESAFNWLDHGAVILKKVKYINHAGSIPDGIYSIDRNIFGYKHEAYSFENELRIVITRGGLTKPASIRLPIDLKYVISKINVAPEAGGWFYDLVVDLVEKYNLSIPVVKSDLSYLLEKAKK